ncbi:hypothetical protein Tco_1228896 [Tanacetum coccineum]
MIKRLSILILSRLKSNMDSIIPFGQKNTLAEYMILSGADNHPPMLDKDLYDSWKSKMELYMQNREHGRMILESVEHGLLIWPTIEENRVTRTKKCLPVDIYSLVNHHRVVKDLWERVQLLMQVNTKFLNSLLPEWSKFVTDVKLLKDLHTTNYDQLHAYLEQYELYANEVCIMRERNQDPLALVDNHQMTPSHFNTYKYSYNNPQFQQQFSPSQSPHYGSIPPIQHYSTIYPSIPLAISYPSTPYPNAYSSTGHQEAYSGLAVPVFKQGDDPIDAINKMISFLSIVGRQSSFAAGTSGTRANISGIAQGSSKVLNEEELEFLADPEVAEGPFTQIVITHNVAYQADDLDAYDSNCDDFSTAKAVLMANLSSYGLDVLSEVPHSDNTHIDMLNQSVQEMSYAEQTHLVNYPANEITSDSNIISYSQYLLETQNVAV